MSRRDILLVEDNADAREALALVLEHHGYAVRTAPNGTEALEQAGGQAPDLLITDRQGIEIDYCGNCRSVWLDCHTGGVSKKRESANNTGESPHLIQEGMVTPPIPSMLRPNADTRPTVIDCSKPKGLPMAIDFCPTRVLAESESS